MARVSPLQYEPPAAPRRAPKYRRLFRVVLWCLCSLCFSSVWAQKQVVHQSLYWVRYYNLVNFNKKWSWHNEFDTRHFFVNNRQNVLIIHSRAVYKPTNQWSFGAAMTYSAQRPQNPFTEPRPATQELRPWQEVAYNQVLSKQFSLNFRIRTEERFISKHSGELDGTYTFIFRHRYRAQLTYLLPKKNLTFRASEEVFANAFNGNRFDQNRLYVSAEKRFNPALSFEIGYMKIYQPGRIVNQIFKRDNLRLTLYHTIRPL